VVRTDACEGWIWPDGGEDDPIAVRHNPIGVLHIRTSRSGCGRPASAVIDFVPLSPSGVPWKYRTSLTLLIAPVVARLVNSIDTMTSFSVVSQANVCFIFTAPSVVVREMVSGSLLGTEATASPQPLSDDPASHATRGGSRVSEG
jgi:hypothetical protein